MMINVSFLKKIDLFLENFNLKVLIFNSNAFFNKNFSYNESKVFIYIWMLLSTNFYGFDFFSLICKRKTLLEMGNISPDRKISA